LRDYKFITTKNKLFILKLEKMANVKKSTSNGGGMVSIIMACIGVGY
jgi:hypothetical protein